MKTLHIVCLILVIIGALNWGLVGFFGFDLVGALFGGTETLLSRITFALVGIAGLILALTAGPVMRGISIADGQETHPGRHATRY